MGKVIKFDSNDPKSIYSYVNQELENLVNELSLKSEDEKLQQAQTETHAVLSQRQAILQKQIIELENNAEWNTFTLAFYGETGAGKSTLIEALRILLQEPTKLSEQKVFKALQVDAEALNKKLDELQHEVKQRQTVLSELEQKLAAIEQDHNRLRSEGQAELEQEKLRYAEQKQLFNQELEQREQDYTNALAELNQIQAILSERERTASFWKKLLSLFKKEPEDIGLVSAQNNWKEKKQVYEEMVEHVKSQQAEESPRLVELRQRLADQEDQYEQMSKRVLAQQQEKASEKEALLKQQQAQGHQLAAVLSEMEQYADGRIVGDGRSDFTRQMQRYDFSLNGHDFAVLDVPGIEGKEGLVLEQIEQAVQKAHAVFYITNKAAPPQTGDEQMQGTLEKIKMHLGSQTEVWSLFNKKINNVKNTLIGRPLVSEDEAKGLQALNEKMREQLEGHYRDVFALTARPAFLVSTDHFLPESKDYKDRRKILAECAANELLDISKMNAFLQLLDTELLQGSKAKIRRANFNKVGEVLNQVKIDLSKEQNKFAVLSDKIKLDADSAESQLDISVSTLEKRLKTAGEGAIHSFEKNIRKKMYEVIDNDVDNDKLKFQFKKMIEIEQQALNQTLPCDFKKEIDVFESSVSEIFQRFQTQAKELSQVYAGLSAAQLDGHLGFAAMKIDNGVKVGSLLLTLVGGVLAVLGSGGWVLAVALVGVALSFGKSIIGYFDSDYKKAQQRQFVDKGLRSAVKKLSEALQQNLDNIQPELHKKMEQIKQAIQEPSKQTAAVAKALLEVSSKINILSIKVNEAGRE